VAVTDVSPSHEDTIGPFLKGLQYMVRGDSTAAHDPDRQDIGRVFQAHAAGQIRPCVTAPIATEGNDPGFESVVVSHGFPSLHEFVNFLLSFHETSGPRFCQGKN
jgi:hypothetical protein